MNNTLPPTLRYTFLLHSSSLGGAERSALQVITGLIEKGNSITCLVPDGPNDLSEMLQIVGSKVERLTNVKWWTEEPIAT